MIGYLIDTNIWSYLQRRSHPLLEARMLDCTASQLYLSTIVRGELEVGYLKGDRREHRRDNLNQIIASTQHLVIDQAVALTYAKLRTSLELAGTPIGRNDTWIAAEALHHNLTLITDNIREFERVAGLRVENWTE